MKGSENLDFFDLLMGIGLVALILLTPLPFGSVAPWARNAAFLVALVLTGLWIAQSIKKGRIRVQRGPVWIGLIAVFSLVIFQQVPLSAPLLGSLSPAAAELYTRVDPAFASGLAPRTLSLDPHATQSTMLHFGTLALVLLVVMNTVRTRLQIKVLVVALTGTAVFQGLYGFIEQVSGHNHVFWNERIYNLAAVSGTFHNKNHFAGLLTMIFPLVIGLFIAAGPGVTRTATMRARLVSTFTAAGTHRQILLGACLALIAAAVFFSLSRMGFLSAALVWTGFTLALAAGKKTRRQAPIFLLVLVAALALSLWMGIDLVVDGLDDAASGDAASWGDRVDLWASSLSMITTYPWVGSGLGTFETVFESFQSDRFGNRVADFLHNDFLQVFCELGLVGGGIIVLGGLWLILRLIRRTVPLADPFYRWIAWGAMAGILSMTLHSLFDYNLYKITSNGVIFAVILGLWHAIVATNRRGREAAWFEFSLSSGPLAWTGAGLLFLAMGWPSTEACREGLADIELNRYTIHPDIEGRGDDYHFLKEDVEKDADPAATMRRALSDDPSNPRLHFHAALLELKTIESELKARAVETARSVLDPDVAVEDPETFERTVEVLTRNLVSQSGLTHRCALLRAERSLRRAVLLSPAKARYHLKLAAVLARLASPEKDGRTMEDALEEARLAVQLCPHKPELCFEAGKLFLSQGIEEEREAFIDLAMDSFRQCLKGGPEYAEKIYPLVESALGGVEDLILVTPKTAPAYERLCLALEERQEWSRLLAALDTVLDLQNNDTDVRTEDLYRFSKKRWEVLGLLGRRAERENEGVRLKKLTRILSARTIEQARELKSKGRVTEAFRLYLGILENDGDNPEALLGAAHLASFSLLQEVAPPKSGTLDLLLRLVSGNDALDDGTLQQVLGTLDMLDLENRRDRLQAQLIRGACLIEARRGGEGVSLLEDLSLQPEARDETFCRGFLVWSFLGKGYEQLGNGDAAKSAYSKTFRYAPSNVEAFQAISRLDPGGLASGAAASGTGPSPFSQDVGSEGGPPPE